MATSVYFNGKKRTLPGVYSTITSGDNTATRTLDYGTVLLIDTGNFGAGYGGGAGINGTRSSGRDSVYEFEDLSSFREYVKGGMFWKTAEALWVPDPYSRESTGISKLLYVRACTTTPATMTFTPTGGGTKGGNMIIKTIDEGVNANGVLSAAHLKNGYAYTVVPGSDEPNTFVMKFWKGTYSGDYIDPVTGAILSYNELSVKESDSVLICETPEFLNLNQLYDWCRSNDVFGSRFYLDNASTIIGDGSVTSDDILLGETFQLAIGGTEEYKPTDLDELLKQITDVEYNIVFTDQIGNSISGAINLKVIAHCNVAAKFDKFVYLGAYDSKINYKKSLDAAKSFNSAWIVCVHGGIGTASDFVSTKVRWWGVFYNLCQIIGRVSGKPPYIPATNKTIGGDRLQHIPDETEMLKAVTAGLTIVYPNPYLKRFVILQAVTTLQDNTILFTKKGESFSLQFMRIIAQLNKECVVNAEIDLLGDENGVNINSLSKRKLEDWTKSFLQSRVATINQDNLISRFQNVIAVLIDDYYSVSYQVVINNEITKIFFTGFLLRK